MSSKSSENYRLSQAEMLELKRWNTPSVFNGWEQVTSLDSAVNGINLDETRDFMPQMGPMVGRAVTLVIEASNAAHRQANPDAIFDYYRYVASLEAPKIVVVQDLDSPRIVGALWGEVGSTVHRALGCVGTITDGAIRDVDEMTDAGFKGIARRLCVGHAHVWPVRWDCEVKVFGQTVRPGQLIHADKHGFLAIDEADEKGLLDATRMLDANECNTVIAAGRSAGGKPFDQVIADIERAAKSYGENVREHFGEKGEW